MQNTNEDLSTLSIKLSVFGNAIKPYFFIKTKKEDNYRISYNSEFFQDLGLEPVIKRVDSIKDFSFLFLKQSELRVTLPQKTDKLINWSQITFGTGSENEKVYINKYHLDGTKTVLFCICKLVPEDGVIKEKMTLFFISDSMSFEEFIKTL